MEFKLNKKLIPLAILSPTLYAGTLGAVESKEHMLFTLFEAAYSWPSEGNVQIKQQVTSPSQNGWGGRAAAGLMLYPQGPLKYSIEAGWGYYNKSTYRDSVNGLDTSNYLYGFDILAGPNWDYQNINLFFKLGVMFENYRMDGNSNISQITSGGFASGVAHPQITQSVATPELKVGGIYDINDQWGITLAYMYVFGNNTFSKNNTSFSSSALVVNNSLKSSPIEMSSVMFGLRYQFA